MFNVCPNCGEYAVEKIIDNSGPYTICPHCHHAHPFLMQPLFLIGGASGTGKTTVCLSLISMLKECVVLEKDILWGMVKTSPTEKYSSWSNVWLRIAKNIGQSGHRSCSVVQGSLNNMLVEKKLIPPWDILIFGWFDLSSEAPPALCTLFC